MEKTLTEEEITKRAIDQLYNAPYMEELAKDFARSLNVDPPSKEELKRAKRKAKYQKRAKA